MADSFSTAVKQLSEPKKRRQDCLVSSTRSPLSPWSVFAIYSILAVILGMWHSSTRPSNVQVTIARDQFYYRLSPVLVPQASNAGVRRSGYKASMTAFLIPLLKSC